MGSGPDAPRALVGTSGWQYGHWRGRFYPREIPTTAWLAHYAGTFQTVEVNASFYRLPRPEHVRRWADSVPRDFVLTFKASRYLTHILRLRDCEEPMRTMWEIFQAARPKLGPVLFQLPPNFSAAPEVLASFVRILPEDMRAAFEFRHPSWFAPEVLRLLDDAGAALVHADRPGVRADATPVTGGWSYLRFHQGRRATPGYARRKLRAYADAIARLHPQQQVFAYFNNDAGGAAVRDAMTLIGLLQERYPR